MYATILKCGPLEEPVNRIALKFDPASPCGSNIPEDILWKLLCYRYLDKGSTVEEIDLGSTSRRYYERLELSFEKRRLWAFLQLLGRESRLRVTFPQGMDLYHILERRRCERKGSSRICPRFGIRRADDGALILLTSSFLFVVTARDLASVKVMIDTRKRSFSTPMMRLHLALVL